jgi:hypothetical protein
MNSPKYVPSASDTAWLCGLIELLKEGGTWGIPCSGGTFRFYKESKEYSYSGNREHEADSKTMVILTKLGWKERKA